MLKKSKQIIYIMSHYIKILWIVSKLHLIIIISINIIISLSTILDIYIWRYIFNAVFYILGNGKTNTISLKRIYMLILFIFLINAIKYFLNLLSESFKEIYGEKTDIYVTNKMIEITSEYDLSEFDKSYIYNKIRIVYSQSYRLISLLNLVITSLKNLVVLVSTTIILARYKWILVVLCYCSVLPIFLINLKLSRKQRNIYLNREEILSYSDNLKSYFFNYSFIKEMKIYGTYNFFKEKIFHIFSEVLEEKIILRKKYILELGIVNLVNLACNCIIKVQIIFNVIQQRLAIGDLSFYISSVDNTISSFRGLLITFNSILDSFLYLKDLIYLLNTEKETLSNGSKHIKEMKKIEEIELKNIYYQYHNRTDYCIRDVSIKLMKNKIYAVIGENGSGKTTLIKIISGLYNPQKGSVFYNGIDIKYIDKKYVFSKIKILFQDYVHYPLDIKLNIGLGDIENIHENINKIEEIAKYIGIDEFVNNLPNGYRTQLQKEWKGGIDLSIGQWQRLAIARSILDTSSEVLILDEPTASLDKKSEKMILEIIKKISKSKIVIIVTHKKNIINFADEVIHLANGKIYI